MEAIEIIPVGSKVFLDGEIAATVQAVEIRGQPHSLTYQCIWWDDRVRKSEWVRPDEIQLEKQKTPQWSIAK
jgi:hypothetical protein